MTEPLSPLDSMFLVLEEADDAAHMHIGAALVFDAPPVGEPPSVAQLRERIAERLPLLPRFAQRLSSPHTRGLSWLTWEPAGALDLAAHVRLARLPTPGGEAELLEWLADFWSHRLDRRRPLWEVTLLEGLAGGRWALATKTHHCVVDGVGGQDIANVLLDGVDVPDAPLEEELPEPHRPGRAWLSPGLLVRGAGTLRHPVDALVRGAAVTDMLVREEVIGAPHSSLNEPISGTRAYDLARFSLAELKEIRAAHGGTVNDVVLALCTGALRRLLLERGEQPPKQGLRAQIPVNVRSDADEHALGNKLTSLYVELPVNVPEPLIRLQLVRERTAALKRSSQPLASQSLAASAEALPPAMAAALARMLYGDTRLFNLTITNVPGSPEPLSAWGAPMVEVLPLVPLFAGHGLGIAVFSYAGGVVFGLNADRAVCPDVGVVAEGLRESFEELRPSVHRSARRPGARRLQGTQAP